MYGAQEKAGNNKFSAGQGLSDMPQAKFLLSSNNLIQNIVV
jgi:hypothetical protein